MRKKLLLLSLLLLGGLVGCEDETLSTFNSGSSTSSSGDVGDEIQILYCSPDGGTTDASGTRESPYDVQYAMNQLKPGGKIVLLEGTYVSSLTIQVSPTIGELYPATSEEEMKVMEPDVVDGEYVDVLFDFSMQPFYSANRGISIDSNYWHIKGFTVTGAGDNGVYIGGNHNIVEDIEVYACRDSGIQLGRSSSSYNSIDQWPSYNLIKNCTSHDNADPSGEDSDGFACKLTTGYGNVFEGCIAYNNIDDGWDLYSKGESGPIGPVTLIDCVAFNNGITTGGVGSSNSDGNGFKLGGENISVAHKVINCIAFDNMACGFTDNSNPGPLYFENCTAFNNGSRDDDGYNFSTCRDVATSLNYYKNCLSFCTGSRVSPITGEVRVANSKDEYKGSADHCLFYNGLSNLYINGIQACDYSVEGLKGQLYELDEVPFVSIESIQPQSSLGTPASKIADVHSEWRDEEGNLDLNGFLQLKEDSPLQTMGADNAPLGANL
ncbi:MAG: right-handed parallel beta-helix repeat-containing protein [Firmicutes bacterium]|uniref:Right-handed parallel beta-helix repeat-containing protein n=1 Tax=Candidatus Scatoplasma merdavium TaxID=2840932 RepID=A0A9D9GR34_9BACL|nr:right-handed parallel beta-helix repeat-containing protein [Candidatus Scatoplasma merdavium]